MNMGNSILQLFNGEFRKFLETYETGIGTDTEHSNNDVRKIKLLG